MKRTIIYFIALVLNLSMFAQVGIGTTTPDASSALEIKSSDKGLLIPRMTTNNLMMISSPASGLMVYDTDVKCIKINLSTNPAVKDWKCLVDSSSAPSSSTRSIVFVPNNTDYTVPDGPTDVLLSCYQPGRTITLPDPALHTGRIIHIRNQIAGVAGQGCFFNDPNIPVTYNNPVNITITCVGCGTGGKAVESVIYPLASQDGPNGSYIFTNSNRGVQFYSNGSKWLGISWDD